MGNIDLFNITKECMKTCQDCNINIHFVLSNLSISSQLRRTWGYCNRKVSYSGIPVYRIVLSKNLQYLDLNHIKSIILHELLHTCEGCMNHGALWQSYGRTITKRTGIPITVHVDPQANDVHKVIESQAKYKLQCKSCGREIFKYRLSNLVLHPEQYRCGQCGGHLAKC